MPGEAFAQSLTWNEFLNVVYFVRDAYNKYMACDICRTGSISTPELGTVLAACGLQLGCEAVDNIRRCYDADGSGQFEFDEFIQLLVEGSLYERCFDARVAQPAILTPLNMQNPLLGQAFVAQGGGQGLITLDKSAF